MDFERPCEFCKYSKDGHCSSWDCVPEKEYFKGLTGFQRLDEAEEREVLHDNVSGL
jgi:hypothetical protein